ncbi:MAG: TonB-dependent receptor [Gemmatimonadales bacterium]|nr:TonB-dependent receptor [Gemmatimonadales bacterium]
MRAVSCGALVLLLAAPLAAQVPARRDSTARDTARVLPELTVTVTRAQETVSRVPAAVSVVDPRDLKGAQANLGLDESLNNLPGVYVANRYNFNLDQRLVIRGFGTRSNFGLRGIKVMLDGIPQTLPDGQSQLNNVDFANLGRIEVLRGASSSLYGNASGGVVSLTTEPAGPGPFSQSVRAEGGSFGLFRIHSRTTARRGAASGTLSLSRTTADGSRQWSRSEFTQLNLGGDYLLGGATTIGLRFGYTDAPIARNPGALTATEFLANPDSASANSIRRRADKDLWQGQLAVTARHFTGRGEWSVALFGVQRDLKNALGSPPPQGPGANVGIYNEIGRKAGGVRLAGDQRLGRSERAVRVVAGLDLQTMRDDRRGWRSVDGQPDTLIQSQLEKVTEVGPFLQLHWSPSADLALSGGLRYDAVRFDVADKHLLDGVDGTGDRTMSAASGNLGATWLRYQAFSPYVTVSTSFETPTTTELANQPNSTSGFNTTIDPSRSVNYELGARGVAGRFTYSVAGFVGRVKDAIVQFSEVSGRGYFTNAGRLKNDGIELGVSARVAEPLRVFGNWTYANYRYDTYRIVTGATVDTLDGKRLPGVPKAFIRLGLRAGPIRGFALDLDHTMSSSLFADDKNTIYVSGWGAKPSTGDIPGIGSGVTNLRLSWEGTSGGAWIRPFLGINNLGDRTYVSALTINGAFGLVFEPAPGRNYYVGAEIGWAAR